jgi:uncharacterized BrkB/YihY/UPF0761 family membrane protein
MLVKLLPKILYNGHVVANLGVSLVTLIWLLSCLFYGLSDSVDVQVEEEPICEGPHSTKRLGFCATVVFLLGMQLSIFLDHGIPIVL